MDLIMLAFILAVATVFALAFAYTKHVAAKRASEKADTLEKQTEDKYAPLSDLDVMRLAKTGCRECHGAGHRKRLNERGESVDAVCPCVIKKMAGNPAYARTADGTPCRVLSMEERLRLNAEQKGGAQC